MSFFEDIIGGLFQEIFAGFIRRIGAAIRWVFLRKKYNFQEVLLQDWNFRIGIMMIFVVVILAFMI